MLMELRVGMFTSGYEQVVDGKRGKGALWENMVETGEQERYLEYVDSVC